MSDDDDDQTNFTTGSGNVTPKTYQEIGRLGGASVMKKYGRAHFREIGRKGGLARKRQIEEAQAKAAAEVKAREQKEM